MNKAVIVIVTANNQRIYWLFCWTDEHAWLAKLSSTTTSIRTITDLMK